MITNEQITQCRNILLSRQSELINQVQDHYGLMEQATDSVGELSSYDNHPGDLGTELFERGKDIALNEHAEKELEEINEAIHAIEEGTYGICIKCGESIPFERLLAVPTTKNCVNHGDEQIFTRNRPVEEEVFSPNINPGEATIDDEDQVIYDAEDAWQEVSRYGTSETPSDLYGAQDNYDEMYPNSDELVGSVEEVENYLAADIYGNYTEGSQKYD